MEEDDKNVYMVGRNYSDNENEVEKKICLSI